MFAELLSLLGIQKRDAAARFDALESLVKSQGEAQTKLLREILAAVSLPAAVSAVLVFDGNGQHLEGESIRMKVSQNTSGTFSVILKNAAGGPGRVDGVPTWKAEPAGVIELTPAADGLTCAGKTLPLASPDEVKSAVVTFTADGDLGDGVQNIVLTGTVTVYDPAGNAVTGELVMAFGTPVIEPPTPPIAQP